MSVSITDFEFGQTPAMQVTREQNHPYEYRARHVAVFPGGIRVVVHQREDSWTRYVIVPRQRMIALIRKGLPFGFESLAELLPAHCFRSVGYGGPGRCFANEPCRIKRTAHARFVVFQQMGGRDV